MEKQFAYGKTIRVWKNNSRMGKQFAYGKTIQFWENNSILEKQSDFDFFFCFCIHGDFTQRLTVSSPFAFFKIKYKKKFQFFYFFWLLNPLKFQSKIDDVESGLCGQVCKNLFFQIFFHFFAFASMVIHEG